MLLSTQHLLRARVGVLLGSLFIGSWAFAAGLLIWNASFGEDPLENVLYTSLYKDLEL